MIVKIHSRGAGSGSGPVDYLLGKDRQREQASVLRGNPEHVRELIDGCDFARACRAENGAQVESLSRNVSRLMR